MTKENKLKNLDEQITEKSHNLEALSYAKYLTDEKLKNARNMVENVPQNIYIEEWKAEAQHLDKISQRLDKIYNEESEEQSRLCAEYEATEQGKAQAEALTLKLDPISARIVADMLEYYNLANLEEAEKRDPFKDNGYLIKAIKDFLKAYEEATK